MAKAIQCDRCYKYFTINKEIPVNGTDTFLVGISYRTLKTGSQDILAGRKFELCDECLKKIKDFMEFRTDLTSNDSEK